MPSKDDPKTPDRPVPRDPSASPDLEDMMKDIETEVTHFKDVGNRISKGAVEDRRLLDQAASKGAGPVRYGYSMTLGPDGKPVAKEVRNSKKQSSQRRNDSEDRREPLVEVIEGERHVKVIAELPGVEKDDLDVIIDERRLEISVERKDRKYHKELELPLSTRPESAKSAFNNGVLEITFEKKERSGKAVKLKID